MKKLLVAVLALSGAGCVEVERGEFDDMSKSVKALEKKMIQDRELQLHLYNELVRSFDALGKRVNELETTVKTMQATVDNLEQQLKIIASASPAKGPEGGPGPEFKPRITPEDIQLHIQTTIAELRQEKLKPDDAAGLLLPYAVPAAPRLFDELASSITKFEYSKQLESILAKFPTDALRGPVQKALTQRGLRESAARVIGRTKSPELGKFLEIYADATDEDFRLLAGESLVLCHNGKGIPVLLNCLRSTEMTTRTIAIAALKHLSGNQDFGYRSQFTSEQNSGALKAWDEWYDKSGKALFEGANK